MPEDYELWTGQDGECQYLLRRWPDGTFELATRPLTKFSQQQIRWSPPMVLTAEPVSAVTS